MIENEKDALEFAEDIKNFDGIIYWLQVLADDGEQPQHVADIANAAKIRLTLMRQWARDDSKNIEKLQPFANAVLDAADKYKL